MSEHIVRKVWKAGGFAGPSLYGYEATVWWDSTLRQSPATTIVPCEWRPRKRGDADRLQEEKFESR